MYVSLSQENKDIIKILNQIQQDIIEIRNILKLSFAQSTPKVGLEIGRILDSDQKKFAYELTDGHHSARDIAQLTNLSITTIHVLWRKLLENGLLTESKYGNKRVIRKNFSLNKIGIGTSISKSPLLNSDEVIQSEIPDEEKLKSILNDQKMFKNTQDLADFMKNSFNYTLPYIERLDLIQNVITKFHNSPRRDQLLLLQALRNRAVHEASSFVKYFETWEKHIRGAI